MMSLKANSFVEVPGFIAYMLTIHIKRANTLARLWAEYQNSPAFYVPPERSVYLISRSLLDAGYRVTRFDHHGPSGHSDHATLSGAIDRLPSTAVSCTIAQADALALGDASVFARELAPC